jgi:endonuclease/exonuclease/phosphatase family metal-dependent hydrolase
MTHPSLRAAAPTVLIAAVFLLTVELLRATSPLLDLASADIGVLGAAGLAVVIFAAPALVGAGVALIGPGRTVPGAVALLLVLGVVAQAQDPATLPAAGAAAATGVATLVLVLRLAPDGVAAGVGVLLGTVADLAVRAGYGTWDPIVRPGPLPWLPLVATGAVSVAALLATSRTPAPGTGPAPDPPPADQPDAGQPDAGQPVAGPLATGRVAVIGPYLALYVLGFGSAPVVAAHAGVSLPLAAAVLIAAAVLGMELVRRVRLPGGTGAIPEPDRWFAGMVALVAVVGAVAAGYWLTGAVVLAAMVVAALAAVVLLVRALTPRAGSGPRRPVVGLTVAAGAAGLGFVLPVMIYQVHFELRFPFDNRYALVAAAALVGLAGLGWRPREHERQRRPLSARPAMTSAVAALALLMPLAVAATRPAVAEPAQAGATIRLMSWNVMYGRDHTGGVADPEAVAAAIGAADPDVVLLQEVSRGWPIGGGVDMLEYLSRRLAMPYRWSPAADGQFGNAVLTRLPLSGVEAVRLPFLHGPMERSYLAATLHLSGGGELRVINAHLQHRKENTATRLVQSQALLAAWDGRPHTVIAGDFNFWPSWEEPRLWREAGFVSAQDVTGHGAEFTVPSDDPDNRVDWIFGTPDLSFSDFEILTEVTNSDHFPLVVTVEAG